MLEAGFVLLAVLAILINFFFVALILFPDNPSVWTPLVCILLGLEVCFAFSFMKWRKEKKQKKEKQEQEEKSERYRNYNDPRWRAAHPQEARQIAQEKEEEERKRKKEEQELKERLEKPAVKIYNATKGHYVRGTAYRMGGWEKYANSAGGWGVGFDVMNVGIKEIKYVNVHFVPYNPVGDICYCKVTKRSECVCQIVGPLRPGQSSDGVFNNCWYNILLDRVEVVQIHVDFMDGTSQDIYQDGRVENHGF